MTTWSIRLTAAAALTLDVLNGSNSRQLSQVSPAARDVYARADARAIERCPSEAEPTCSSVRGAASLALSQTTWLIPASLAQERRDAGTARTPWGDPDLQGEWTAEGEYGVPLERPAQFGTRAFLTDAEYAQRLADVRARDARDLARVDVFAPVVEGANAPIPHWREYGTNSRRTSLIVDPPDGRLPRRAAGAPSVPVQRCGSLQRGEPCDTYEDYSLGVRCIVHGGGFPDAMFPAVYNANFRILQSPGLVAISYELIHDTRIIPLDTASAPVSSAVRAYMGIPRGRWEGQTLVVESTNFRTGTRGATRGLRLVERFTRVGRDAIDYRVTFDDPAAWTAPWTAALDLKARPDDAGVFEYACHEGNYGMAHMLAVSRLFDEPRTPPQAPATRPSTVSPER